MGFRVLVEFPHVPIPPLPYSPISPFPHSPTSLLPQSDNFCPSRV
ncbi:hypothetical protein N44_00689 [Microcystis aeruginosa NIES-44]|uniref:Uncharacterized protein n=1 Tax=Microcystis aeruginosa NIES-44 TaxID=449439 RepID=A0A0A1VNS9_MICAE|nr:hypothetical protein N44_00689 [Microcystis aeruginosa NIES-44]